MSDGPLRSWLETNVREMFHRLAGQVGSGINTVWEQRQPGSSHVMGFLIFRAGARPPEAQVPVIFWLDKTGEDNELHPCLLGVGAREDRLTFLSVTDTTELADLERRVRKFLVL